MKSTREWLEYVLTFQRMQALSMKAPSMIGPGNAPNTLKATLCKDIAITRSLSFTHLKITNITKQ